MDNRIQVDAIYTDFSSAFDTVNHKLLLQKLATFGIDGSIHTYMVGVLVGDSAFDCSHEQIFFKTICGNF